VTTYDRVPGRIAAVSAGLLRPRFATRLGGCLLLLGLAVPAFAQQAVPAVIESGSLAAANPLAAPLSAPAISDEIQLPGRAGLFATAGRQPGPQPGANSTASTGRIQNLIQHALALLGTPYRWGGTGTDGFDCSGLVGYVFRSALGIELPRVSKDMASSGQLITDRANLSPGDLVFFGTHHGKRVDHVGIYVGDGRFLHAPRTGRDVTVSSLESGYWSEKYMEARRVAGI
jgi:cell wall-associated NlpC family hydrolase